MTTPSFEQAAKRHLRDARHLEAAGYLPNADHLSGFSAECAIKGLVVDHLGGQMQGSFPATSSGQKLDKHIGTWLWSTVAALANGRVEPEIIALFQAPNPFTNWRVGSRYTDGSDVSASDVAAHIEGARLAIIALEAAKLAHNEATK